MIQYEVVPEFQDYVVSSLGDIFHERTERKLTPHLNGYGVAYVTFFENGRRYKRSLALVVAEVFLQRPMPSFNTPINLNGDRLNCSVRNLAWRPRWFATKFVRERRDGPVRRIEAPLRDLETERVYRDSFAVSTAHGLLEFEVVQAVENRTYVWPTYQLFDLA